MVQARTTDDSPPAGQHAWKALVFQFEQAWQNGTAPRIDEHWPAGRARTDPVARALLKELVQIDLEYRWRQAGSAPADAWILEEYVARYPELGPLEQLGLELIGQEYEARQCWGDRPSHGQYAARFPRHGTKLGDLLRQIDADLATEFADNRIVAASQRPLPGKLPQPVGQAGETIAQPVRSAAALLGMLRPLLSQAQLDEFSRQVQGRSADPMVLARELLQRGWLTPYQLNQLMQGRVADLVVGPYLLLERLGAGGAGQVFKARHQRLNRIVALKVIRKELLAEAEVVGRFYREIQILSQLDHPHVVHAYDAGPAGATHFLAMEYVEGSDLGRLVKRSGPMPVEQASAYILQAALGLAHAHERGLVHRDIKPHNLIMSVRDGVIKAADLGLARLPRSVNSEVSVALTGVKGGGTLTPENAVLIGTTDYLAPEQALDFHKADIRADIYSLGCTFYYLLTGQPPFPGVTIAEKLAKHMQAEPPPLQEVRPDVPAAVAKLIRQMMAKRPEDRPQTPAEVAEALAPLAGKSSSSSRWRRTGRRLALAGAAILLVAIALFVGLRSAPIPNQTNSPPRLERFFSLEKREQPHIVDFCFDGKLLASSAGNKVFLWDMATGNQLFSRSEPAVSHLALSPDGRLLGWFSCEGQAWKVWDLRAQREVAAGRVDDKIRQEFTFFGPFTPDGKYLGVRQATRTVALVEIANPNGTLTFPNIETNVLAFSPDAETFAVTGNAATGNNLALYDLPTRKQKKPSAVAGAHIPALAMSRTLLAVPRTPGMVQLLDVDTFQVRGECKGHKECVMALAFTRDGKMLATGGSDGVKLWDTDTGKELHSLPGYTRPVRAVAFRPDGKVLMTKGDDDLVKIWRVGE